MESREIVNMKTKKVDWRKRYYNLRRKYKKLMNENVELGSYKNSVLFYNGKHYKE